MCQDLMGNFFCQCKDGWAGRLCDKGKATTAAGQGMRCGHWDLPAGPLPLFLSLPQPPCPMWGHGHAGPFWLRQEREAWKCL